MQHFIATLVSVAIVAALPITAGADEIGWRDGARAYALIVGSNPGGEGQDTLQYAERDAERVAEVLRDLGGYDRERVRVVLRPSPGALLDALDSVAAKLAADQARGQPTVLFFYYSGHAKASALNLGADELPLDRLRRRLMSLPSSLTIVVLDACQSGAFSRIKGAEPAADFSFNSVRRLDARGVAVMASSSGTELSQESVTLRSSYFTHYLLVALRGAGDENRDGRVSLDEAYRYAYQATLTSTARTAVGRQHVTLETDLKGKGEIPLTYPSKADAHVELPAAWSGEILVQRLVGGAGGAVVAEVHKRANATLSLALPHGRYRVLARDPRGDGSRILQCEAEIASRRTVRLTNNMCSAVAPGSAAAKGLLALEGGAEPAGPGGTLTATLAPTPTWTPTWTIELQAGGLAPVQDAYTERLDAFEFGNQKLLHGYLSAGASYALTPYLHVVGELKLLERGRYHRDIDTGSQLFEWNSAAGGAYLRGWLPLGTPKLALFAQAGGGLVHTTSTFYDTDLSEEPETQWGYHLGVAGGVAWMPWQRLGIFTRIGLDHAPALDNLIGDVHDTGGISGTWGLRFAL